MDMLVISYWSKAVSIATIVLMIDDFRQVPSREPSRLDTMRSYRPPARPLQIQSNASSAGHSQATAFEVGHLQQPSQTQSTVPDVVSEQSTTESQPSAQLESSAAVEPPYTDPLSPAVKAPAGATITLFRRWRISRKKFIIASVLAVVLLSSASVFALTRNQSAVAKPVAAIKPKVAAVVPKPIVSPLTGLPVSAQQHDQQVIGAMIENSPDARPQSGLKDAGVVYEAIAEAGITRFLALYQELQPTNIGPIRSSRPYYLDWAMAFDASYAHVGGSPDALQRIKDINVKDLDQFYNPTAYHRITARFAPHNVYTGVGQLVDLAKSKGYTSSSFTSFIRKTENPYKPAGTPATATTTTAPTAKAPKTTAAADSRTAANTINLNISGDYYNARYDYQAASNNYKRSEGGAPHMDADSNTQLQPKVVIALVMPYSLMADGYHSLYTTIGSGAMYVFQDGTVTKGTWSKGEPKSQFIFKDTAGKDLALNPGQTWISVVSDAAKVSYQ